MLKTMEEHTKSVSSSHRSRTSDLLDGFTSGDFWLKAVKKLLLHATCCVRDRPRAHARHDRNAKTNGKQGIPLERITLTEVCKSKL